jgi:hypothetical protein
MAEYLYNNEAIGMIAITSVIQECKELSYSKSMLILPFLFHEETMSFLKRSNTIVRSSEEIIMKKTGFFSNFNSRYYSLLPISINSIMILREIGEIVIAENKIIHNSSINKINLLSGNLGDRANNIRKAAYKLSNLLQLEDDSSMYLKLRIQL